MKRNAGFVVTLINLFFWVGLMFAGAPAIAGMVSDRLARVNDWVYVLQLDAGVTPAVLAASGFDLVVMDYSADGSGETEFAPAQIQQIKDAGKIVLAYMSVGEAEESRFYWQSTWSDQAPSDPDAPAWLGPSNPDWPDCYKVHYWDAQWKALLWGSSSAWLDRIVAQGFDGVYLDIVDAYEYWGEETGELTRQVARERMVALVTELAAYARQTKGRPDFLVIPQNGAAIIYDDDDALDDLGRSFLALVDGLGAEDTFYDELTAQPAGEVEYSTGLLDLFLTTPGRSRLVLTVDYVWDGAGTQQSNATRYMDFATRAQSHGTIPYAALRDRELNQILPIAATSTITIPQPRANNAQARLWP